MAVMRVPTLANKPGNGAGPGHESPPSRTSPVTASVGLKRLPTLADKPGYGVGTGQEGAHPRGFDPWCGVVQA